jgi:HAMP domain-containing protein
VALVVTMGASLQVVISAQLARQFDEIARERARDVASVLASSLLAPVEFEDTVAIEAALQPFRQAEGAVYAEVRSGEGKSLAILSINPAATRSDVAIGGIHDDGSTLHTAVQIPTATATGTPPHIVIGFSTAAREARIATARRSVLSMTALLVCVAAGLAFLIGRRLARPLEELSATATRIVEQQDLRIPVEAEGDDELGRLARGTRSPGSPALRATSPG